MQSNGHSGVSRGTAIIGETKLLDLSALFGSSNGTSNGSGVVSSGSKSNAVTVSTHISKQIPLSTEELFKLTGKSSNNHANSIKASTSNEIIYNKLKNQLESERPSWNSRLCFSGNYIFYKDPNYSTKEYGESGVHFKCSYPGCFKRLSTNVNFINHVWAHAKTLCLKEATNGSLYNVVYGVSDIGLPSIEKASLQCVECLADFTSLRKLYEHQFYVHRFGSTPVKDQPVCHICEKGIHPQNAEKHAEAHGEYDMPFLCPICGFRTSYNKSRPKTFCTRITESRSSSRISLLFHFERNHNASTTLMCPFCLDTFIAKRPSAVKSQRTILTSSSFVEHILEHFQDSTKKANCIRCSLKFFADDYKSLTEKIRVHTEMHRSNAKLQRGISTQSLSDLIVQNPNQREATIKSLLPVCTDCGYLIKSVESHYRKKEVCDHENCFFWTGCRRAFKQHTQCCPEKEGAKSRMSFGKGEFVGDNIMNSLNKARVRLRCSMCSFTSKDSGIFSDHLTKICVGAQPLLDSSIRPEIPRQKRKLENNAEIDLFALHSDTKRLKTVPGFFDKAAEEKPNWLAKIAPFIDDKHLAAFKKPAIVTTLQITDKNISSTRTNSFFSSIKLFDCDYDDNAFKLAARHFPYSRYSQRR